MHSLEAAHLQIRCELSYKVSPFVSQAADRTKRGGCGGGGGGGGGGVHHLMRGEERQTFGEVSFLRCVGPDRQTKDGCSERWQRWSGCSERWQRWSGGPENQFPNDL